LREMSGQLVHGLRGSTCGAVHVERQPEHDAAHLPISGDLPQPRLVLGTPAAQQGEQRGHEGSVRIGPGKAEPPLAGIDAEERPPPWQEAGKGAGVVEDRVMRSRAFAVHWEGGGQRPDPGPPALPRYLLSDASWSCRREVAESRSQMMTRPFSIRI